MSPWDECGCGHNLSDHHADYGADDPDEGGCAMPTCPCPWFDADHDCPTCGFGYGCQCA